jgi:protease-4
MKQFFKTVFACLVAMMFFFFIIFAIFGIVVAAAGSSGKEVSISKNSILELDVNETILEQAKESNPLSALTGGNDNGALGLNDILASIKAAKTDDNIKGIYIKLGMANAGWATINEIKNALTDFKTSRKFIIAYGEMCDQKAYYMASAADKLYINPSGGVEFKGISTTGMFFKNALDKLDIKAEGFHCGKYKGAYEPYKLEKYSEPNRYQLTVLLNDIYNNLVNTISTRSGQDTNSIRLMMNNIVIKTPSDAVANHLFDKTMYINDVIKELKAKTSTEEKEKLSFISPDEYATTITNSVGVKNKIAILYAEGEITSGDDEGDGIHSETFLKSVRKLEEDENIKAVVLRINSPGGSALASEVMYHELMELKSKKPIIVSMGNVAASGGYYMACTGDSIFADANTITGSIGVVGVMFNVGDFMKNKLGVTTDVVKTAEHADFPNGMKTMTDMERTWIEGYLDTTYMLFKSRVAKARNMTMEKVEELAQGHVYSGTLAKELKLIDRIGSIDNAIQCAVAKAGIKDFKIVEYPKPVDRMTQILNSLSGNKQKEAMLKQALGEDYTIYKKIQSIKSRKNEVMTRMEFDLEIR